MSTIYCEWCGESLDEHVKDCPGNLEENQYKTPDRNKRYCVICGVIPVHNGGCKYYVAKSNLEYCLDSPYSNAFHRLKSRLLGEIHQLLIFHPNNVVELMTEIRKLKILVENFKEEE